MYMCICKYIIAITFYSVFIMPRKVRIGRLHKNYSRVCKKAQGKIAPPLTPTTQAIPSNQSPQSSTIVKLQPLPSQYIQSPTPKVHCTPSQLLQSPQQSSIQKLQLISSENLQSPTQLTLQSPILEFQLTPQNLQSPALELQLTPPQNLQSPALELQLTPPQNLQSPGLEFQQHRPQLQSHINQITSPELLESPASPDIHNPPLQYSTQPQAQGIQVTPSRHRLRFSANSDHLLSTRMSSQASLCTPQLPQMKSNTSPLQTSKIEVLSQEWLVAKHSKEQTAYTSVLKLDTVSGIPTVSLCVQIATDNTWSLFVHGVEVSKDKCQLLSNVPVTLDKDAWQCLLTILNNCSICPGNPDKDFIEMSGCKRSTFSKTGKAFVDNHVRTCVDGGSYTPTIRCNDCPIILMGTKCSCCVSYRNTLRKMKARWLKQKTSSPSVRQSPSSRTNVRFLKTPERLKRYKGLRSRLDNKIKENKRLRAKIKDMINKQGNRIDHEISADLHTIMNEMTDKVYNDNPPGSFRRLFWEEQMKALQQKDKRQIRWHEAVIKWCLHLKYLSSSAYHALRSSGIIQLPSERTLYDYSHWIESGVGFMKKVDEQLKAEANIQEDKDRYVVLVWDEMKIKESLVYDKHSCRLTGFTNVGDINNRLNELEMHCTNCTTGSGRTVASHMLMFMVRGIFTSLEFPYA